MLARSRFRHTVVPPPPAPFMRAHHRPPFAMQKYGKISYHELCAPKRYALVHFTLPHEAKAAVDALSKLPAGFEWPQTKSGREVAAPQLQINFAQLLPEHTGWHQGGPSDGSSSCFSALNRQDSVESFRHSPARRSSPGGHRSTSAGSSALHSQSRGRSPRRG
eukprot:scaffold191429_cov19-Tisochrysis_lutea.AAC.1